MEYGHTGLPSPTVMKEFDYDDAADIEAYIEKAPGRGNGIQHTGAQHQAELDCWAKKTVRDISKRAFSNIDMMKIKKALQDERAKFRKFFAKEFNYTKKHGCKVSNSRKQQTHFKPDWFGQRKFLFCFTGRP